MPRELKSCITSGSYAWTCHFAIENVWSWNWHRRTYALNVVKGCPDAFRTWHPRRTVEESVSKAVSLWRTQLISKRLNRLRVDNTIYRIKYVLWIAQFVSPTLIHWRVSCPVNSVINSLIYRKKWAWSTAELTGRIWKNTGVQLTTDKKLFKRGGQ